MLRVGVRAAPLAAAAERALRAPASRAQRARFLPARPRPSEVAWRRAYLHRSRDAARRASRSPWCTWRRAFSFFVGDCGLAMLTWARLLLGLALLLAVRAETEHTRDGGPCHSLLDLETDYLRDGETQAIAAHPRMHLRPPSRWLAHARPRALAGIQHRRPRDISPVHVQPVGEAHLQGRRCAPPPLRAACSTACAARVKNAGRSRSRCTGALTRRRAAVTGGRCEKDEL